MSTPNGFIDLTGEDGYAVLVRISEIAMVREAGLNVGRAMAIVHLRSGEFVAVTTEFTTILERLSQPLEKDS